ncbi:MAG: hypothetical protein SNH55_01420 [Rikenellaceae bacterium]
MNNNRGQHIFGVAAIFISTTLIAVTMLLFALLLYLAELIGSLIGALLILGLVAAVVAIILYLGSLRPQISAIRDEISTIYEMAYVARCGYDWIRRNVELFLKGL